MAQDNLGSRPLSQIVVDPPRVEPMDGDEDKATSTPSLASFIVGKLETWRDHRDVNFKARWDEYYRLERRVGRTGQDASL